MENQKVSDLELILTDSKCPHLLLKEVPNDRIWWCDIKDHKIYSEFVAPCRCGLYLTCKALKFFFENQKTVKK